MFHLNQTKKTQTNSFLEEKEISKGILGSVLRCPNETIFTFFKSNIDKRKKLKEEMNNLINSYKIHKINQGILKIKSINTKNTSYKIITEPVINSLSNLHYNKFKGFEIYKMFTKFNLFIKYCFDNKINLSNLKLSDVYLTVNYELKLLTVNYDTEILHKIKKEKYSDNLSNNKNNTLYNIGIILYYLYYNEYPSLKNTKFPKPKNFKELIKYCLKSSKQFNYNEYINHTFFHPDIIFNNNINKSSIISFNLYKESKEKEGFISSNCEELYFIHKETKETKLYSIYNSFDKNKIMEENSNSEPKIIKLKFQKNNNLYLIIFSCTVHILKKNNEKNFVITQVINLKTYCRYKDILELSTGELVINDRNIYIYHRTSEDKFEQRCVLSDVEAEYIFETEEQYLNIINRKKTLLYEIKSNMKKIKEEEGERIYINEQIFLFNDVLKTKIYHCFFEEEIMEFDESILCAIKKKDGTYLFGGYDNNIYQLYFDKYGFIELISKVDSGYGYYEDDLSGDCMYSYSNSRNYSVGFIEEYENGTIMTISDLNNIKKIWKLSKI